MKIHLLSDLHLEFKDFDPPATDADVVVLAGDIHVKGRSVEWAQRKFNKPVVMVLGNHDYWGGSLLHTRQKAKAQAQDSHVHLLHNEAVVIDGVRFLGATLWTDFALLGNQGMSMWEAETRMNDYRKIRNETFGRLKPYQLQAQHAQSRQFLQKALETPFDGPTVVVTHHAPTGQAIPSYYEDHELSASYASSLEFLMGRARYWCHGHIHESHHLDVQGTKVVCNPRGYDPIELNANFNPALVLEV